NIARDVVEDKKRNRIYIEQNFENIVNTIKKAEVFYNSSFTSIKSIPLSFRFAILVARRVYKKIGDKILLKKNIDTYNNAGKIYVNNFEKTIETFNALFDFIELFFLKNENELKKKLII
ncbi:MAG: phytoene synthase, partial [Pelagibacteraceae bacterium]